MSEITDEAKKALADLKAELSAENKTEIAGLVSKEVIAKMEEQMKAYKKPEADVKVDPKGEMVKYFKAKYEKDINGNVTDDLKLGRKSFEISKKDANVDLDTTQSGGGEELVPEYFGSEVLRVAEKVGVARQNSRVITLPGKTYNLPTMGTAVAYRTDEKVAIDASTIETGQLTFTAKKLAGMVIATRECVEDANVDVVAWISQILGEAIAKKEDQWAFLGTTGTEGIFRNNVLTPYTLGSGDTTFAKVDLDDMLAAMSLLSESVVDGAKWLFSFSLLNHLRSLKNETTGLYYLQAPAATMPRTIWDLPFVMSPVMPKTSDNSQADAPFMALYNPNYLMIGDRRSVSLDFSKEASVTSSNGSTNINLFEQDCVAIKITERIDIQLANADKAFTRLETSAS
jgi:HK97 family phage major capsid protein